MREIVFLRKHSDKWKEFEEILKNPKETHPDRLADLYIDLTNDLAYAQSNYPESKTTDYLNQLSIRVHDNLYKSKKENKRRIITFWTQEIPLLYATKQKELFYSFVIFALAFIIGFFSAKNDPAFVRLVLGDAYVNLTIDNIENEDPLGIYKRQRPLDMFSAITFNNVLVSFNVFIAGIFTSIRAAYILFVNGISIGSFFQFFSTYGLLEKSILVVFIHGTLELSAIVLAGAAGIAFGNSFLFPGTYTRTKSFIKGGKEGMKMVVGLFPVFVLAGFLESFVTRYTEMPLWLSLFIIIGSLVFILFYFIYLPITLKKKHTELQYEQA